MEKRCSDCSWEFYKCDKEEVETEDGVILEDQDVCPECGSSDWEYKLMGQIK